MPGASAGVEQPRIARVEDYGEHVGIVDHAFFDGRPGKAAIHGLPRQVPGAGVDDLGVVRIDGQRLDVLELGMSRRRDPLPRLACIAAAEHAIEGARDQDLGIRCRQRERAHRLAVYAREHVPGAAAVIAAKNVAAVGLDAPRGGVDRLRMSGIEHDVIDDVMIAVAHPRQPRPGVSAVVRNEQLAGTGAQQDAVGVARIGGQAARVSAIGTDRTPRRGRRNHHRGQNHAPEKRCLAEKPWHEDR